MSVVLWCLLAIWLVGSALIARAWFVARVDWRDIVREDWRDVLAAMIVVFFWPPVLMMLILSVWRDAWRGKDGWR